MDVKLVSKVVGFLAALSLASVAVGAPLSASESGPPTPASSEGNPSIRGSNLLNRLHENASRVRDEAAQLEVFDRECVFRGKAGTIPRSFRSAFRN